MALIQEQAAVLKLSLLSALGHSCGLTKFTTGDRNFVGGVLKMRFTLYLYDTCNIYFLLA